MQVRFDGADELKKKLDKLGNAKAAKRIARKAARQAMNIVRDAARANAKALDDPETTEKIWKNIATQSGKSRNRNNVVMRVGVRGGASYSNPSPPNVSGGDTRYWRFLELGTSTVPATPFMRPAFNTNAQAVTDKFTQVFSAELDKEMGL